MKMRNAFKFASEKTNPPFLFRREVSGHRIVEFWVG